MPSVHLRLGPLGILGTEGEREAKKEEERGVMRERRGMRRERTEKEDKSRREKGERGMGEGEGLEKKGGRPGIRWRVKGEWGGRLEGKGGRQREREKDLEREIGTGGEKRRGRSREGEWLRECGYEPSKGEDRINLVHTLCI